MPARSVPRSQGAWDWRQITKSAPAVKAWPSYFWTQPSTTNTPEPGAPTALAHAAFPWQRRQSGTTDQCGQDPGNEPMQVVSGRLDRPVVHFEAPPRNRLDQELATFIHWFNSSQTDNTLHPLLRAAITHFWFVTLHPFDDGNGRLTRSLTDLALAQSEQQAIRFYAMSASILEDRKGYYQILESTQKGLMDITAWLQWFLQTLLRSLEQAQQRIDRVLIKARYWQQHRQHQLSTEQLKVLNRLLDGGDKGFANGINAAQYQEVAKVSKATATRHLADLLEKRCLVRLPGEVAVRVTKSPACWLRIK